MSYDDAIDEILLKQDEQLDQGVEVLQMVADEPLTEDEARDVFACGDLDDYPRADEHPMVNYHYGAYMVLDDLKRQLEQNREENSDV